MRTSAHRLTMTVAATATLAFALAACSGTAESTTSAASDAYSAVLVGGVAGGLSHTDAALAGWR